MAHLSSQARSTGDDRDGAVERRPATGPAPGSLASVQRFINSTEMPDGVDELRTGPLAARWLREAVGADP